MQDWIANLFSDRQLLRMGHAQRLEDLNLGFGWLYYGLTRLIRPSIVVVIGSWRGFSPLVFGKGLADNLEPGHLHFIDPSLVDDFWKDSQAVRAHFARHGLTNVQHHLLTTQEFVATETYRALPHVDLLFVDGYHTAEQARFDYEAFAPLLTEKSLALFHDSCSDRVSKIYGPENAYRYTVRDYLAELKRDPQFQVLDLPFAEGITVVRKASAS